MNCFNECFIYVLRELTLTLIKKLCMHADTIVDIFQFRIFIYSDSE